jgi:hypothetical protein
MGGVKTEARSKWECPECDFTYESPVEGTIAVSHPHSNYQPAQALKKTWGNKYDKVADQERKERVRGMVFYV